MAEFHVDITGDAAEALDRARSFLERDPVQHNLQLTLLEGRCARPEPGQYATVSDHEGVIGLSFRSPLHFHAAITPMPADAVEPLVDAIFAVSPELSGVLGAADTAARFAGRWAELAKAPAAPVEGQRMYELRTLKAPAGVPGGLRPANADDVDLLVQWMDAFASETGAPMAPAATVEVGIADGLTWIWENGDPVGMAAHRPAVGGVSRIGPVYTPPDSRRRGYGAACTAAVTQAAFDAGATRTMLFTQLSNPQSNAIYRRLGYEPVGELVRYRLGP